MSRPAVGSPLTRSLWIPTLLALIALLVATAAGATALRRPGEAGPGAAASVSASGANDLVRGQPENGPAVDAVLAPAPAGSTHEITLVTRETEQEIAPGVRYPVWTFGDRAPGPVLHVRQGDTIHFTLHNEGAVPHSMDFHAAQTPWDQNYRSILPGQTISFTWQANHPGAFLYHCGTAPGLLHLANGMYGAIIVDPAEGLPPAKEFVLVQSEFYAKGSDDRQHNLGDYPKMLSAQPDFVVFNGRAEQYTQQPLTAEPGERLRFWVVNAGPSQPSAFHIVGAIFDAVYPDGNPSNRLTGMQTYTIPPGGGAMVELTVPEAGLYPVVSHSFASAMKGALAILRVGNPAPPPEPASH